MTKSVVIVGGTLAISAGVVAVILMTRRHDSANDASAPPGEWVPLPAARVKGGTSLEAAIAARRSRREFEDRPLTREQVAQLCWAAQGITDPTNGFRTTPSAGALYPATIFLADADGVFEYDPTGHALRQIIRADVRKRLQAAAHDQASVGSAPACLIIAMNISRTAAKYGTRAERYCLIEAGHIAQNVLLQATADGLTSVPVGAFDDAGVRAILNLSDPWQVVYLLPVGKAK